MVDELTDQQGFRGDLSRPRRHRTLRRMPGEVTASRPRCAGRSPSTRSTAARASGVDAFVHRPLSRRERAPPTTRSTSATTSATTLVASPKPAPRRPSARRRTRLVIVRQVHGAARPRRATRDVRRAKPTRSVERRRSRPRRARRRLHPDPDRRRRAHRASRSCTRAGEDWRSGVIIASALAASATPPRYACSSDRRSRPRATKSDPRSPTSFRRRSRRAGR